MIGTSSKIFRSIIIVKHVRINFFILNIEILSVIILGTLNPSVPIHSLIFNLLNKSVILVKRSIFSDFAAYVSIVVKSSLPSKNS